ncbi:hypothetical protein SDC9_170100 [bioreactor metagenome]|uniref:Uncharacterized protein n=1 Tax=bioreactor metagenome TaxID=1076179 RepID=A0A645G750_9ZZZZ
MKIAGAAIITEPRPELHQQLLRRFGQRFDCGQGLHETLEIGDHRLDPGLLEHDLGDPDAVGVPILPPRQDARVNAIPTSDPGREIGWQRECFRRGGRCASGFHGVARYRESSSVPGAAPRR